MSIEHADLPMPPSSFTANRPGVPKERMITVMIEPDNWLTKARQGAQPCDPGRRERRRYRSDDQAGSKGSRAAAWMSIVLDTNVFLGAVRKLNSLPFPASTGLGANRQPRAGLGLASGLYLTDETRL